MKTEIVKVLKLLDRTVAYYPILGKAFGTSNAGLFVCQMLYWEGKQRDPEGWIQKTTSEIESEIGLSRHELDNVKRKLVGLGVCEFKLIGTPPTGHWRFDWQKVDDIVNDYAGVEDARRAKLPPQLTPSQYERRMGDLANALSELEKKNKILEQNNAELMKQVLKMGKEPVEKPKPLPTLMAEVFDKYFQLYNSEAGKYKFQDKDFGQLKNLEKVLRSRNLEQKQAHAREKGRPIDDIVSTDADVMVAWDYLLANLPVWYQDNNMSPAAIYSNLMTIIQQIKKDAKLTNDTKSNKEHTPINPFAAAAKRDGEHH